MKVDKQNNIYVVCCVVFLLGIIVLSTLIVSMTHTDSVSQYNEDNENIKKGNIKEKMNTKVKFDTNYGSFEVELFTQESPITAGNFEKLVREGFYDGVRFHRVMSGFMIQGGDPLSKDESLKQRWGTGNPGYTIEDEFIENLSNIVGTLSMANSGPNSGGSQFFINVNDNTFLDWDKEPLTSKHPVFGKVISGLDVVYEISNVETEMKGYLDRPIEDVIIEKITIIE